MTLLTTRADCGCELSLPMGGKRPERCVHGNPYLTQAQLNPKPRSPLKRSPLTEVAEQERRKRRSTLKRGKGFSASKAQQAKVRDLPCIVCGRDRHEGVEIQAAHVYPRRFATCDCAEGVAPICASDHMLYDGNALDLLPLLLNRGYRRELVHAIVEHDAAPLHVFEVVTGVAWAPAREVAA